MVGMTENEIKKEQENTYQMIEVNKLWVIKKRRLVVGYSPWARKYTGGYDVSIGAAVASEKWGCALALGWGWDSDNPLRPWPWVSFRKWGFCISVCGLFINLNCRKRRVK